MKQMWNGMDQTDLTYGPKQMAGFCLEGDEISVTNSGRLITVAARSKAWTVFASLNTGIVGSNPTQRMDVCVCLFWVCVVLCVDSGIATGWSPFQEVLRTM
jgi:hypothetical protein